MSKKKKKKKKKPKSQMKLEQLKRRSLKDKWVKKKPPHN